MLAEISENIVIKTIILYGPLLFWRHVWLLSTLLGKQLSFSGLGFHSLLMLSKECDRNFDACSTSVLVFIVRC